MKKKSRKKNFNLGEEYKNSWNYLKESKTFIYFMAIIFFIFFFIGLFISAPEPLYTKIMEYIKELLGKTEGLPPFGLIWFIISNNVTSTFFSILLGIILGIFPLINSITNGYLLGFVSSISVNSEGFSSLWRILPHGVFELPAVFIALGLGARLGTFIFQKNKIESLKYYFISSFKIFLLIIIPLLILAGIIEGTLITLIK